MADVALTEAEGMLAVLAFREQHFHGRQAAPQLQLHDAVIHYVISEAS